MKEKMFKNKRKRKPGALGMVVLLLLGMAAGSLGWLGLRSEVKAAEEMIQVFGISVIAKEDGICAGCSYRNFDSSIYTVQLYLEKQNGTETIPVVYRNLSGIGEEEQQTETEVCNEGSGIYRAVLLTRVQGETTVVRFRDSGWYEAVDMGDHYEVRPYAPGSGENTDSGREEAEEEPKEESKEESGEEPEEEPDENTGSACEHKPARELYEPATPQRDAIFGESCELCGQVLAYGEIPNTAYVAFLDYAAGIIRKAQPAEQVVVDTDRWISFDKRVLDAIKERPDVSILIRYRDQGEEHQVLLPADADVSSLGDENGFCGFRYLRQIFGEKIDG